MAWIACVVVLRFFVPATAPLATASGAPPPPAEDRLAVAGDANDGAAGDPFEVDDGDDDPDDAALPAAISAAGPRLATLPQAWHLVPLTDKVSRDPLFRPPRAV